MPNLINIHETAPKFATELRIVLIMSKESDCTSYVKSSEGEGEGPRVRALKEALDQTTSRVLAGFKPTVFAR